jgi:hypothetical protein
LFGVGLVALDEDFVVRMRDRLDALVVQAP